MPGEEGSPSGTRAPSRHPGVHAAHPSSALQPPSPGAPGAHTSGSGWKDHSCPQPCSCACLLHLSTCVFPLPPRPQVGRGGSSRWSLGTQDLPLHLPASPPGEARHFQEHFPKHTSTAPQQREVGGMGGMREGVTNLLREGSGEDRHSPHLRGERGRAPLPREDTIPSPSPLGPAPTCKAGSGPKS